MVVGCNNTTNTNVNTLPTGEKGKVVNVVETKATLPKFTVGTMGLYDGGFTRTGGGRKDDEFTSLFHYITFSTCSLICSNSSFICTTIFCISA